MTAAEALRRFEQRLIPVRTVAGAAVAWEAYASEWLTVYGDDPNDRDLPLIRQGFDAGYDAAMASVRSVLGAVQSEALRESVEV